MSAAGALANPLRRDPATSPNATAAAAASCLRADGVRPRQPNSLLTTRR